MKNLLILFVLILPYLKIYIAISKIFKLESPFNSLEKLVIPILLFEIFTILVFYINPSLYAITPTSLHFLSFGVQIYHITLYSILYLILNITFVLTTLGLSDSFIPLYNYAIAIHFILTAIFKLLI